jgi:hypothetical protein
MGAVAAMNAVSSEFDRYRLLMISTTGLGG